MRLKSLTILTALVATLAVPAGATVKIADISRLGGQRTNMLTGMGLVIGLKGTGDGGDFSPAINPMVALLKNFANASTAKELANASDIALVLLNATIPANGVRDGDRLDVYVSCIGKSGSIKGGRLFIAPMQGPNPSANPADPLIFAMSEGPIVIEDPSTPTVGVVKGGCVMEADMPSHFVESGRFTIILDEPSVSWTVANSIADVINQVEGDGERGETLATAIDSKNIIVTIPRSERDRPDGFISRIQRLPVKMLPTEARVTLNDRTGTIIMTGDVEISPVVISHKGLTISTVNPAPVPSTNRPLLVNKEAVALDTTSTGGGKLQDLLNALDSIKTPAEDRIAIIKELHRTGKLHAKLVIEGRS